MQGSCHQKLEVGGWRNWQSVAGCEQRGRMGCWRKEWQGLNTEDQESTSPGSQERDTTSCAKEGIVPSGAIKEGQGTLLQAVPWHIQKARDYYPFGRGHTANVVVQKVLKGHPHKKGKVHQQWNHYGGRKLQCIIRKLPPKFKDPGSVTIPCSIGSISVGKALIDLGATINLMSLSMCRRIGNLKIKPTSITL